jgi:hypothetical protein
VAIVLAPEPPVLFRIGRAPDPLVFPPLSRLGHGRYDDPLGRVPVLYAATERIAAFMETLDQFRFDLAALAARDEAVGDGAEGIDRTEGIIPEAFFDRRISRFGVAPDQRWPDARHPATHVHLRSALAARISALGPGSRFVLGDLLASDHRVTRLIGEWAIDHDFAGIAYASCHHPSLTCWAVYGGAELVRLGKPERIAKTDPDLKAVAELWNLRLAGG